ncbi:MAG: ABC transporter permease [Clostridia bacterium]|nr:ABC transporter permease [Clostridia bacterium]
MSVYLGYLKIRFLDNIQYKMAAFAGVLTQFAWGGMYIMLFATFLQNGTNSDMTISQMSTYIWLQQAFFMMFNLWSIDKDVLETITSGNIAMELIRPVNLYHIWHARSFGTKIGTTIIRCIPMILICSIMPIGEYGLSMPASCLHFIFFIITLILSMLLVISYIMIMYGVLMSTFSSNGIRTAFQLIAEFFSGMVIPIAFMPDFLIKIIKFTPFYYMQNVSFNVYSGYISDLEEIIKIVVLQIFWLMILTLIGKKIIRKQEKKIVVQGG